MVFQHFNLYRDMSVLDNVTLALRKVQKLSKDQANERGLDAPKRVGLRHKAKAFPYQLSGGQQQRVGFARSLALTLTVLLFHKPTGPLDPELVAHVITITR